MRSPSLIVTHPGGAHKDEFLACCVLVSRYPLPVERREPTADDLEDERVFVVDVGHEHDPAKRNFDHHQFPRDAVPTCSLSLVLQDFGLYEDAKRFCDWLEPAEWFDCLGPRETAKRLNAPPDVTAKLVSPIDVTMLRRFAGMTKLEPGNPIYEVMRMIGEDLCGYVTSVREQLDFVKAHAEQWSIPGEAGEFEAVFMPRTDPLIGDPSNSLERYVATELEVDVVALVYPDRRSSGYGLSRYRDNMRVDFTRLEGEPDVHFAHARGFVAKTTATDPQRLKKLLSKAQVD
jgi:hypothetical protein